MKKAFKYIFLSSFLMMSVFPMSAQEQPVEPQDTSAKRELPLAPRDESVKRGVLPNGMSYYLVPNSTTCGIADFALIQKRGTDDLGTKAYDVAREALASLPRFQHAPQSFLAAHSVAPGRNGYVKVSENATLFHFDNVILTEESVDSLLLVMMDIADRGTDCNDSLWNLYTPADQAVIVSGDIDTTALAMKLQMLSYMTPYRCPQFREENQWQPCSEPRYSVLPDPKGKHAVVSATWASARPSKEHMNTLLPVIYGMFVNEIGILAQERISKKFKQENIPVVSVGYDFVSGRESIDAECLTVSVTLAPEYIGRAVEIIASTMSSLDRRTASEQEFLMAKGRFLSALENETRRVFKSNTDNIIRCASSFIYGANLLSADGVYKFLKYRNLEPGTELRYFNDIASALLDAKQNLTVCCTLNEQTSFTSADLEDLFQTAWRSEEGVFRCIEKEDTLSGSRVVEPVKLRSAKTDPISGGVLWTFTNGFKVVYKKLETDRRMFFALALNGGYGNIRGLSSGEGAYVSDYLALSQVAGLDNESFRYLLEQKGVELQTSVNLSNTIISGHAPRSSCDEILKVLSAFVNDRGCDRGAFDYYKSCQKSSATCGNDRMVTIDSLLWPGYGYSDAKIFSNMSEDFDAKVETFWKHQASKTNDGVLILVGDIDEVKLKKCLLGHVGAFATTDRVYPRVNIGHQPVAGSVSYAVEGDSNSIDIAITMRLPFSAENYMASNIAASVLRQRISKSISGTGMYLKMDHSCRIYPHERLNVSICLEEADPMGFAPESQLAGASEALSIVKDVLDSLPDMELNDEDIQKYKDILKAHLALKQQDPQYWIHAIAMRHLDGKDLTTSYESRIDDVTAEKVKSILSELSSSSRVEYIIKK